jgi:hypothetical protein
VLTQDSVLFAGLDIVTINLPSNFASICRLQSTNTGGALGFFDCSDSVLSACVSHTYPAGTPATTLSRWLCFSSRNRFLPRKTYYFLRSTDRVPSLSTRTVQFGTSRRELLVQKTGTYRSSNHKTQISNLSSRHHPPSRALDKVRIAAICVRSGETQPLGATKPHG